ncbi:sigma-54 dependent transcriptional regulator [Myxococcota bacterium]|nr:sigma-54 dependent transcriptional regulator [Myxococcota bacterium]MBU1536233.1 sigma-54 dependent transcriptional regulator [Myxococcota bacterium]
MAHILVIDDEREFRTMLGRALSSMGHTVQMAQNGEEALALLGKEQVGLILLDMNMEGDSRRGIAVFTEIKARNPGVPVVFITGYGEVKLAVDVMKLGAQDFLEKPVELSSLREIIQSLTGGSPAPSGSVEFGGIRSSSVALVEVVQVLEAMARSDAHLLITGESGTGKEVAAEFIHARSNRRTKPFLKMNCAAIPQNLLESEVFGVEKGAFTGASVTKPGRFEAADGGTLLLDEIGEMDITLQAKLLRVIQEKEFERVGSHKARKSDVRIIATTNVVMARAIEEGTFREDLYYRLNVFEVVMPSLRERADDIIPLAERFLAEFSPGIPPKISPELAGILVAYPWPGNIRELRNAMERGSIMARGGTLEPAHMPLTVREAGNGAQTSAPVPGKGALQSLEKSTILETLEANGGNRTHTARALGISRRALQYKLKKWNIE